MHQTSRIRSRYKSRSGSALIVLAVMTLVALAIASYAINVVYMEFTRTELQISTDLTTRAACRALVDTGKKTEALRAAQRLAQANPVATQPLSIDFEDLTFSVATRSTAAAGYKYAAGNSPNAVHLRSAFFERSEKSLPMLFPTLGISIAFRPFKEASAVQAELDIAIVLDCSSSMMAAMNRKSPPESIVTLPVLKPVPPFARWRAAEAGIHDLLDVFEKSPQRELVSISTFNSVALLKVGLSDNYAPLRGFLTFNGQLYLGGSSNLADGLATGISQLGDKQQARPWASRVILLISDGNSNFGVSPLATAQAASNSNVMIYTISLSSEADQTLMTQLAETAHGKHFHAEDAAQFRTIAKSISQRLPILITQ